jgi:hypothetical protein
MSDSGLLGSFHSKSVVVVQFELQTMQLSAALTEVCPNGTHLRTVSSNIQLAAKGQEETSHQAFA